MPPFAPQAPSSEAANDSGVGSIPPSMALAMSSYSMDELTRGLRCLARDMTLSPNASGSCHSSQSVDGGTGLYSASCQGRKGVRVERGRTRNDGRQTCEECSSRAGVFLGDVPQVGSGVGDVIYIDVLSCSAIDAEADKVGFLAT